MPQPGDHDWKRVALVVAQCWLPGGVPSMFTLRSTGCLLVICKQGILEFVGASCDLFQVLME